MKRSRSRNRVVTAAVIAGCLFGPVTASAATDAPDPPNSLAASTDATTTY